MTRFERRLEHFVDQSFAALEKPLIFATAGLFGLVVVVQLALYIAKHIH